MVWVIADQGLVSGCNFAVGIILARLLGLEGYGHYVLLNAALLYLNTFPGAMLITPLLALGPQQRGDERRRFLRGSFTLQICLSSLLAMVVLLSGFFGAHRLADWIEPTHFWALAFAVFGFQMQDWIRRQFFISQDGQRAFLVDTIAYGGFVASLPLLYVKDALGVANALWVLGGSSLASAVVGIYLARLAPSLHAASRLFSATWRTSFNYLLSWQLQWVSAQGVILAGASVLGAQAAGAIRAIQNIVGPLNVALQLLENLVPVKAAVVYSKDGVRALVNWLGRMGFTIGAAFLLVFAAVGLYAQDLVAATYGATFAAYYYLLYWQCGFFLLNLLFKFVSYYFRILDIPSYITIASFLSAGGSLAVAIISVGPLRETGVMVGLVSGQLIACLYLFFALRLRNAASPD